MNLTTEYTGLKDSLLTDFQVWESQLAGGEKSTLHRVRREAIRQFDRLGFPTTKHEEWKYTNVGALTKQAFGFRSSTNLTVADVGALLVPHLEANVVVFVNGIYQPQLSRLVSPKADLRVEDFADAYQRDPAFVEQHFAQSAGYEHDAFTALSTAFAQHGAFIHVTDQKIIEHPVLLYFISDARSGNVASQPRNLFVVGRNSQVKIAEFFHTLGNNTSFTNAVTEITVEPNAYVEYYKVQEESEGAHHIGTTHITQLERSRSFSATITVQGGFVRNNLRVGLEGEHCEAHLFGLYLPDGKEHVDNHTVVDHAKPRSYSNELYKGILNGRATGVFNGKIFVRPDAQKTNAFQSNRNIILSDEASMNTKPQLEIFADDVKCSHGTTTGQLDEDALFYLRSRGIDADAAKSLLTVAFAGDVISQIHLPALREYIEQRVTRKLGQV
ncbi:MAG: Fe-S cluster assembly protein SufD [Ferruginibacter sp.]|nr:Fe-S cluster assembly protein SufD [Cytophagales bacterium]